MANAGKIIITKTDRSYLESLLRARTVQRARIILLRAEGISIDTIADKAGINRKSVMLCLNKYKGSGVEVALADAPGHGRSAEITDDERAWIISIACRRPYDLGCPEETWTYTRLAAY